MAFAKFLKGWSYSAWDKYRKCPRAFKFAKIDLIEEPKGPPLIKGIKVHSGIDKYLKGIHDELPEEALPAREIIDSWGAFNGLIIEELWAFNKDWSDSDWYSKGTWLRAKIDCGLVQNDEAFVTDWKTGKVRDDDEYIEQAELYALVIFLKFPKVKTVYTDFTYVEHNVIVGQDEEGYKPAFIFERKDLGKLKKRWASRVKPMYNDTAYPTQESYLCGWCHYRKSNGGPCPADK